MVSYEEIIAKYPQPLARPLWRVTNTERTVRHKSPDDYAKLSEGIIKYLTALLTGQYVVAGAADPNLNLKIRGLRQATAGKWTAALRAVFKHLIQPGKTLLIPEFANFYNKQLVPGSAMLSCYDTAKDVLKLTADPPKTMAGFIDLLANIRNETVHDAPSSSGSAPARLAAAMSDALIELIGEMPFLMNYWHIVITDVEVVSHQQKRYRYYVSKVTGLDITPRSHPIESNLTPEQDQVYVSAPNQSFAPLFSLEPLLIYRRCPTCNDQEPRTFLANKEVGRTGVEYLSYGCGHTVVLSGADNPFNVLAPPADEANPAPEQTEVFTEPTSPQLVLDFGSPQPDGSYWLGITSPRGENLSGRYKLPFDDSCIEAVARAINARHHADYPLVERLLRPAERKTVLLNCLRTLGLWDESYNAVVADVEQRVGKQLGDSLLADTTFKGQLTKLRQTASLAKGGSVVLIFRSEAARKLARLPWELALDGRQPLLHKGELLLGCTRIIPANQPPPEPRPVGEQLHVLLVRPPLNGSPQAVAEALTASLNSLPDQPLAVELLTTPTLAGLRERLLEEPTVDVLDYRGIASTVGAGSLLLTDQPPVSVSELLKLAGLPKLIVLHANEDASQQTDETLAGFAVSLSLADVPAVVALPSNEQAASSFYRKLAEGYSVQQAVTAAREALRTSTDSRWQQPLVYLRQKDNQPYVLLQRPATEEKESSDAN